MGGKPELDLLRPSKLFSIAWLMSMWISSLRLGAFCQVLLGSLEKPVPGRLEILAISNSLDSCTEMLGGGCQTCNSRPMLSSMAFLVSPYLPMSASFILRQHADLSTCTVHVFHEGATCLLPFKSKFDLHTRRECMSCMTSFLLSIHCF